MVVVDHGICDFIRYTCILPYHSPLTKVQTWEQLPPSVWVSFVHHIEVSFLCILSNNFFGIWKNFSMAWLRFKNSGFPHVLPTALLNLRVWNWLSILRKFSLRKHLTYSTSNLLKDWAGLSRATLEIYSMISPFK